jgi:hypothetical protein
MDTDATALKIRENRLRRAAERQGLFLAKRRRRDVNALDHGRYAILKADKSAPVHGVNEQGFYTLTLDEAERLLTAGQLEQLPDTAPAAGPSTPAPVAQPEPEVPPAVERRRRRLRPSR